MTAITDSPAPQDQPLQIRFRLTAEETATLANEAAARVLARHDRQTTRIEVFFDQRMPRVNVVLFASLPLLFMAYVGWDTPEPVPLEFWMTSGLAAIAYWLLLWRFAPPLFQGLTALRRRIRAVSAPAVRRSIARSLPSTLAREMAKVEGIHTLLIGKDALRLTVPQRRKTAVVPWESVIRIEASPRYYRICTRTSERVGRGYLVARQSNEMDPDAYAAGLQRLLSLSPVKPVPEPLPANP